MALEWFKKKPEGQGPRPSPPPKTIQISQFLNEDLIVSVPSGLDKNGCINWLTRELCQKLSLGDPAPYLAKIMEREYGISTTLDTGLAIPHARIDGLKSIVAALGLAPGGIPDPKQPELTIRAMFLFFSPNRQEAFTQHLQVLREAAALFQPGFIDRALSSPSGPVVFSLIQDSEGPIGGAGLQ